MKKKVLAQISKTEIEETLKSRNILIGAEWEFIFYPKNVSSKSRQINQTSIDLLEKATGSSINIDPWLDKEAHTYEKVKGWKLEYEFSLPDSAGAELISPPMPLQKFLNICPKVFNAIDQIGKTTNKTGFHIGLSIKGNTEINVLKLALLIDEDMVYKIFSKKARQEFAGPIKEFVKEQLKDVRFNIHDIEEGLRENLEKALSISYTKEHGINTGKLKHGYIEFRYMGGSGYHKKWDRIKNIIGMYIFTLKAAADPEYKKEEYEEKVKALIKSEIAWQQRLIKITRPIVKLINPLFKSLHIKVSKIQRSPNHVYFTIAGDQSDLKMLQDILNIESKNITIDSQKSSITLDADHLSLLEIKKFFKNRALVLLDQFQRAGGRFIIGKDIVEDVSTGLIWTSATFGPVTYDKAVAKVRALKEGGFGDWRIPSVEELQTLVKKSPTHAMPTIDTEVFPNTKAKNYWTSNVYVDKTAKVVQFGYRGIVSYEVKTSKQYLRAVRDE